MDQVEYINSKAVRDDRLIHENLLRLLFVVEDHTYILFFILPRGI